MRSVPNHSVEPGEIGLTVLGVLEHRDIVLRAVSAACKLVTAQPHGREWQDFQAQVVSAVSEAFNNLVLHGYEGRRDGRVELVIRAGQGKIQIQLRDWGKGFDPTDVPLPDLESLPESGLGLFIMQSFMGMTYRRGRPNLLTLSKNLEAAVATSTGQTRGA
jgi:anti-sigma regulatory factor (Ser/Thr protein kinase)